MSYFSTLLTATKTRYNTLRGDEGDGDSEDDSHISRVLRSYYTDQGRGIPEWLGGGPGQSKGNSLHQRSNSYGRAAVPQRGNPPPSLSDIFDSPAPPQNGRPNFSRTQQQRPNLFPGDRLDSISRSGSTAQQKIKDRLRGTRTASPPPNQQFQPPPNQQYQPQQEQPAPEAFNYTSSRAQAPRPPVNGGGSYSYKPAGQMPPPQSLQPGASRNHGGDMPWNDGHDAPRRPPGPLALGGKRGKIGLPTGPKMMRQGGGH
ncbi:hypothetical protein RUND412_006272 [Rhizina undulata]